MLTAIFIPLLLAEQAPALVLICWSDLAGGPWTQIPAPSGCGSQSLPLCPSPPSSLLHSQEASPPPPPPHRQHLQTSLLLEKRERRITSGAIQAYVPAALILVVLCHSRARPKSVILSTVSARLWFSMASRMRTAGWKERGVILGLLGCRPVSYPHLTWNLLFVLSLSPWVAPF